MTVFSSKTRVHSRRLSFLIVEAALVPAEFRQLQFLIPLEYHTDGPLVCKQQQRTILQILYDLHVGGSLDMIDVDLGVVLHPADITIWQLIELDLNIVLVLQTEAQYLKLENADHADDDLFHTGIVLLEDLDRTFLCDL